MNHHTPPANPTPARLVRQTVPSTAPLDVPLKCPRRLFVYVPVVTQTLTFPPNLRLLGCATLFLLVLYPFLFSQFF